MEDYTLVPRQVYQLTQVSYKKIYTLQAPCVDYSLLFASHNRLYNWRFEKMLSIGSSIISLNKLTLEYTKWIHNSIERIDMYGTGFIIHVVDYCVLFSSVRNDKTRYCIKFELFWWNENDSLQSCRGCGISSDIVTSNQSILGRDNNTLFVALTSVFIPILLCTLKNGYLITLRLGRF